MRGYCVRWWVCLGVQVMSLAHMFSPCNVGAGDKVWIRRLGYMESLAVACVGDIVASYAEPICSAEMEE